jgi:hypothetical protein
VAENPNHIARADAYRICEWHQEQGFVVEAYNLCLDPMAVSSHHLAASAQGRHDAPCLQRQTYQADQGARSLGLG